ncbi:YDG domain-containing protein [Chitinophaga sp. Cy-1792]|uniref:MBG domain-containing protein n=1 Tax=Chitinophaga sp. Cy-1792 TaxID=2608339 RepID=UPI0014246A36|nr:YDG domain-containing protein [Chitinophaga sp. Cy-1792]NIG54207.1 T9SS type B sorting domain-containing protein [Chitinophaga sp. Cy-1792]
MKRMRHAFQVLVCLLFSYHMATAAPPGEKEGEKNKSIEASRPLAPLTGSVQASTSVACKDGNTGSITVRASGGTGNYYYSWSPYGGSSNTASNLTAGTYVCHITDDGGNTKDVTATITQPATAMTAIPAKNNILCYGSNTGSAAVIPSGGVPPYTYAWTSSVSSTSNATGLQAGSYTCIITDDFGCTLSKTFDITQPNAPLSATATATANVTCNGGSNGIADVTVSGGTPNYTYSWTPSGGTAARASGLAAGDYTCTITDENNCQTTAKVKISQPSAMSVIMVQTDVLCAGGNNGSATAVPSGGNGGPYTYQWSNGSTSNNATDLIAGTYTCKVSDAKTCFTTPAVTIYEPRPITVTLSYTNTGCYGSHDGTAEVLAAGGSGTYSFLWSNGATTRSITGLAAGTYTCTVTDGNQCTFTTSVNITQSDAIISTMRGTPISCNGRSDGTAQVITSGNSGNYTYLWSNGLTTPVIPLLPAGDYTCIVTDGNGCSQAGTYTVTEPDPLTSTITGTMVSCNGGSDGTATITASGGTTPYTYIWTPLGGTAATATGLEVGTYTCIVTDANFCPTSASFTVAQPLPLIVSATSTDVSCNGGANGTATVSAGGGAGNYTYSWAPSGGTAATATGLTAGDYTCTITDGNTCSKTVRVLVSQPTALTGTASRTLVSCHGGSNGAITLAISGGTPGYTYSWNPAVSTDAAASGLPAGIYNCTVTDAKGCPKLMSAQIDEPDALIVSVTGTQPSAGLSNGTATAMVSGGTPPYSYSWLPSGSVTSTITGLSGGQYTCTVTDANTCQTQGAAQLGLPVTLSGFNNFSATYGDAAFQLATPVSTSNGAFTYTSSDASVASVAGNMITVHKPGNAIITVSQAATGTYLAASTTATLTVSPKDITVMPLLVPAIMKVYDGTTAAPFSGSNYSIIGLIPGDRITVNGIADFDSKNVGIQNITISNLRLNGVDAAKYNLQTSVMTTTGNILSRQIQATAIPVTKIYDGNTTAAVSFLPLTNTSGLAGNDDVTLTTANGNYDDKNAGTGKSVTVTTAFLSGQDAGNYQLMLPITTTGIIQPKTLDITPASASKIYGEKDQQINYTTGNGQLAAGDQLSGSLSRISGENAGNYNITIGNLSGNGNYTLQLAAATFEIKKAALVITADNKEIYRGQPIPSLTYTSNGFVNNESEQVLTTQPNISTLATSGSTPGNYPITAAGATAANYEITFVNGNLKINATTPTDISLNSSTVYENVPVNSLISAFNTSTPLPTTITYSLVTGAGDNDNKAFSITGDKLYTATAIDYETKASYSIRVRATNSMNEYFEKVFTIQVLDVNEAPTVDPVAPVNICYSKDQGTIAVTGISAGPETNQQVTLAVSASEDIFSQLKIVATSNSTAEIRYILKDNIAVNTNIIITVKDNGGTANGGIDLTTVSFAFTAARQPAITATSDKGLSIISGESVVLTATGDAASYTWSMDGSTVGNQSTYTAKVTQTTTFTVTGTLEHCTTKQDLTITTSAAQTDMLKATNVITPDGDGYNDKWVVKNIELFPGSEVKIFDRAGRMIFSRKDYRNEWDGTLNGSPLQEGVYLYVIDLKNGSPIQKGYITIVRKK